MNPTSIAIDSHDNVYVTVQFSNFVAKYTTDGTLIKTWGSQGTRDGQFEYPRGIAVGSSGNVYVTDLIPNTLSYRVQEFTSDGTFIKSWGSLGGGGSPPNQFNGYGIRVDSAGNVYVADSFNNRIQKFTNDGILIAEFGSAGSGDGQFNTPHDIALDSTTMYMLRIPIIIEYKYFLYLQPLLLQIQLSTQLRMAMEIQ